MKNENGSKERTMCNHEGQEATEYLLILAAILVVVAAAMYFVMVTEQGPILAFTAQDANGEVVITVESGTSPSTITKPWEWAVFGSDGAMKSSSWTVVGKELEVGNAYTITASEATVNDTLKIRIEGSVFETPIQ